MRRVAGFSLVELMVTMVIASILMLAMIQVLYGTRQTYLVDRESGLLQENARFALEVLRRNIVRAGNSCGPNANVANVVVGSGDADKPHLGPLGIEGWDDSQTGTDFPDDFESVRIASTDALYVRGALKETDPKEIDPATSLVSPLLGGNIGVEPGSDPLDTLNSDGDIFMVTDADCNQLTVVKSATVNPGGFTLSAPGTDNCTVGYGPGVGAGSIADFDCASISVLSSLLPFLGGGRIAEFVSLGFYVAPSGIDSSVPSLWRSRLNNVGGVTGTIQEELVQGVENMQLTYGYDNDSPQDGVPNFYLPANDPTIASWDWARVTSVRIALLMRSVTLTSQTDYDNSSIIFEGTTIGDDKFSRKTMYSVVHLKNMTGY